MDPLEVIGLQVEASVQVAYDLLWPCQFLRELWSSMAFARMLNSDPIGKVIFSLLLKIQIGIWLTRDKVAFVGPISV